MNIAFCDDDIRQIQLISGLISEYRTKSGEGVTLDTFSSSLELLESFEKKKYDVLLLDIVMPGITGIETAKSIRNDNNDIPVVFLTSSPEYAIEGYKVHAYDYLMKPVKREELYAVLDQIAAVLEKREEASFYVQTKKGVFVVAYDSLEYLEVKNHTLYFNMSDGKTLEVIGNLFEYEEVLLKNKSFLKVHRSFIINMGNMRSYDKKSFTAMNGDVIPISRNVAKEVQNKYLYYLHEAIRIRS